MKPLTSALFVAIAMAGATYAQQYDANWESLDSRPLPAWFDESKIGIFIHWGVYSVPSYINEWFWLSWKEHNSEGHRNFMEANFKPGFTYQEFAPGLTAEFYNPADWADIFRRSGAKYVVLTSKHHEGYAMWPSTYHFAWNAMEVGPHRDLLGDLANATRAAGLRFGAYYSLMEWFSEYTREQAAGYATNNFPRLKSIPALKELVNLYEPDLIWSDGEWEAPETYWQSMEFLAWLYNDSPVKDKVVVNDRWADDTRGKHGGYYNFDDRYNPGVVQPHKWENAMSMDKHTWTHRREAKIEDYLTPEELITTLVETVACGGNLLVNIGPTYDGMIPPIHQERLLQMGEWLGINGEAIYNTTTWTYQNDTQTAGVWYTQNRAETEIYAMFTRGWPGTQIQLGAGFAALPIVRIGILGTPDTPLQWFPSGASGITITLPPLHMNRSKWAWTLVIYLSSAK